MTIAKLRELYQARPFQPFIMHLADGRQIRVGHPEWMAISPGVRTVYVEQKDESSNHIDLLLVTDLEIQANSKRKARAG